MKVEIWSDVTCPFCYIGKRKFEAALAEFPNKEKVEVIWHSYQLNPNQKYQPNRDLHTHVAELKGQTREWSVKVHESVTQTAKSVGLDYHFEKVKIANSFDAHRVIQLAKKYNLSNEIEERFFRAFFTDGEVISDLETLTKLAVETGLNKEVVEQVLASNQYADDVRKDALEAQQLGANGVPYFVFDRKYAVSGAQDPNAFLQILEKSFPEWEKENAKTKLEIIEGKTCTPEGNCD